MEGTLTMAQRLEALDAARAALDGLDTRLWELPTDQLGPLVEHLDGLGLLAQAGQASLAAEAMERGETGSRPSWVAGWLGRWAPSLRAGGAKALASVAGSFAKPGNAPVREAVLAGTLPVRSAGSVLAEVDKLRPRLADGAEPHVLAGLVDIAVQQGPSGPRDLRALMLARHGLDGELQDEQDRARAMVALSQPCATELGTFEYRLTLDAEGQTVLEAALGPLAAPRPTSGCADHRSSDQRRGDALVEVVRRGVAAADGIPAAAKAAVFVTVNLATLTGQAGPGETRAGTICGGTATGTLIAPETVRRLACDADLIPVVLGTRGEVLDLGRRKRLFTSAQTRALWLRDGGCTFRGCSIPAQWADAHHLWHWADGGPTDLAWAALLCGRHHTVVHQRRYMGQATADGVVWDLTAGAYDDFLTRRRIRTGSVADDGRQADGVPLGAEAAAPLPPTGTTAGSRSAHRRTGDDPAPHPAHDGRATGMSKAPATRWPARRARVSPRASHNQPMEPADMMAAVTASMAERTGRTLEDWVEEVHKAGLDPLDQKSVRAWLKTVHGIPQNSQWAIADAAARNAGWVRPDPDSYTDNLYEGSKAHLRPVHDAIIALAEGLGEDTHREGRSSYIPVVRRTQFVAVAPGPRDTVRVGFRFRERVPEDERLSPAKGFAQATHWLHLPADADEDDLRSLEPLLEAAYEQNA